MPSASIHPLLPAPAPVELHFSSEGADCVVRLDAAEAISVLGKITPWPETSPFIFDSPGLSIHLGLSPEGAQVFREEICEQLDIPLP